MICPICPSAAQQGADRSKKCGFKVWRGAGGKGIKGFAESGREAMGMANGRNKLRTLPSDEAFCLAAEPGASSALQHFQI